MYQDFAILAALIIIGLTIWQVIVNKVPFNAQDFGMGMLGPLGGHAAGTWADGQSK